MSVTSRLSDPSMVIRETKAPSFGGVAGAQATGASLSHIIGQTTFSWNIARDSLTWDKHALAILGVSTIASVAKGTGFLRMIADGDLAARTEALMAGSGSPCPEGISYSVQYRFHPRGRADPHALRIEERGLWWPGEHGKPKAIWGVVCDVTAQHLEFERLQRRAQTDELTGQLNRFALMDVVEATLAKHAATAKPFVLMIACVNGLDVVNETFGFDVGDELLANVAQLLRGQLRSGDHIGRLASNKFAIVINDCTPAIAEVVAARLIVRVRNAPIVTSRAKLAATISIGIVSSDETFRTPPQGIGFALYALERARQQRGDSFVAYRPMAEEAGVRARNAELANTLLTALDEQRMVLELQPIVCARTRIATHYECLLRMITPNGERISAGEFMPIAEQLSLSRLIDQRTLELAIELLRRYPRLDLSLNVSSLTSGDSEWLISLHKLSGGKRQITQRLTIEITETAALHDLDQTMAFVDTIKDLGCKAAIDDFGVGYTNFRNLKSLKVDYVKIDGAFVKNVCADKGDQVFIASMVELARVFGMKTVAEWVGDEPTADLLTKAGIDYLQGYHFGEPAPPEQFALVSVL